MRAIPAFSLVLVASVGAWWLLPERDTQVAGLVPERAAQTPPSSPGSRPGLKPQEQDAPWSPEHVRIYVSASEGALPMGDEVRPRVVPAPLLARGGLAGRAAGSVLAWAPPDAVRLTMEAAGLHPLDLAPQLPGRWAGVALEAGANWGAEPAVLRETAQELAHSSDPWLADLARIHEVEASEPGEAYEVLLSAEDPYLIQAASHALRHPGPARTYAAEHAQRPGSGWSSAAYAAASACAELVPCGGASLEGAWADGRWSWTGGDLAECFSAHPMGPYGSRTTVTVELLPVGLTGCDR